MYGDCPCCKKWKKLTRHHDKQIKQIIMVCRDCHNIVEEYLKAQKKTLKQSKLKK